jgi:hypothetical protein
VPVIEGVFSVNPRTFKTIPLRMFQKLFSRNINEEALLLAKYLRNERESWNPRIAIPSVVV